MNSSSNWSKIKSGVNSAGAWPKGRRAICAQKLSRAELSAAPEVIAAVPYFDTDITDLAGLLQLGEQLWR